MKTLARLLFLIGGFASAFAAEMTIHRDLAYAEPATVRQSLDIYAPAKGGRAPVIIWLHGGGWQRGDKSTLSDANLAQHALKPQALVDQGAVFVAINTRFIPQVDLKTMAGDVARAVSWVKRNIGQYGGDPASIILAGHSAGAQLVALVCTDERYLQAEGLSLQAIKGCVPVDGDSYYPALQIETAAPKLAASYRLKFPEGSDRELASVTHIAKGKGIPPFLILCVGDRPETGTALQSSILGHYLTQAGVPARVVAAPGKTHHTLNADLGLPGDEPTRALLAFVDQVAGRAR